MSTRSRTIDQRVGYFLFEAFFFDFFLLFFEAFFFEAFLVDFFLAIAAMLFPPGLSWYERQTARRRKSYHSEM
ncbi:hypothetical protein BH18GEM1_BH18GEM1_09550 [soil metagenome]